MRKSLLACLMLASFACNNLAAQQSYGGKPYSSVLGNSLKPVQAIQVSSLDKALVKLEDDARDNKGQLRLFGRVISVDYSIKNSGTWTLLPNGDKLWRLALSSAEAQALNLYFSKFQLPEGAQLYVYGKDKKQILGAYISKNNPEIGAEFATEHVYGDQLTIEYYQPAASSEAEPFVINGLGYAYRDIKNPYEEQMQNKDFGDAGSCNININCTEGTNWQAEKRAVCRILVKQGSGQGWCTGALVNNAALNCKPYILSAFHCSQNSSTSDFNSYIFYFNFESSSCATPSSKPSSNTLVGSQLRFSSADGGGATGSDGLLIELNANVPSNYNAYYAGWSNLNSAAASGVSIHHPAGDIKKISTFTTFAISSSYQGQVANTHWRITWAATANGRGPTEGGSSGSPIFDGTSKLIVGTLTGGGSSCTNPTSPDYYGKVSYHWQTNGNIASRQLKPWLDPNNTGITTLQGASSPCTSSTSVDAGILAIISPSFSSCGTLVSPIVTLKNFGSTTLTRVTILYRVNNNANQSHTWTGSLAIGQTTNVSLPSITVPVGAYNFTALTTNPNASTDGNATNDSQTGAITGYTNATTPFTENFTTTTFPPTGWWLYDGSNDAFKWARSTAGNSTAGSAFFDNFTGSTTSPRGTTDWFISPSLDVTNKSKLNISFDYAHARHPSLTSPASDSLFIGVSTDCGSNFNIIYSVGGANFATASTTDVFYTPVTADWRNRVLTYTLPVGSSNATVAFINYSDWENNTYLDNINFTTVLSNENTAEPLAIRLVPNPNDGKFELQLDPAFSFPAQIALFNNLGQVLYQQTEITTASVQLNLALPNGIYYLNIVDNQGYKRTEKVIVR